MTSWTDIEQKACADALTDADVTAIIARFAELEDVPSNAQAMALVKKLGLELVSPQCRANRDWGIYYFSDKPGDAVCTANKDLNRAIVECAAKLQETKMSKFKREIRYIVIKLTDLEAAQPEISKGEMSDFNTVLRRVEEARFKSGKAPLECVIIEKDWPEFEPTWMAIEKRCAT